MLPYASKGVGQAALRPMKAMITDENLREICRVDVRAADVAEAGR